MSALPTVAASQSSRLTLRAQPCSSESPRLFARLRTPYGLGLVAILLLHTLLCGYLIVRGNYYPAGIDGNETATTSWEAQNLNVFGFWVTAGLADEAYTFEPAAHPMLHTHQGNFPRLFAALIYAFGARSIEAQVVVTTALIGTLAIFLTYHFLTRLGPPLYAFLASAALLTDYVLYTQWHVVTYRVWYGVFFFFGLLCAREIGGRHRWRWLAGLVTVSTVLFYFELIFTAFVSLMMAFYISTLHWRRPSTVVLGGMAQVLGCVIGIGALLTQLTLYLGWDGAMEDLSLTFVARNSMSGDPELADRIADFYDEHNIAFWRNFSDASSLIGPVAFTKTLFQYVLQVYTPILVLLTLTLTAAWAVALALDWISPPRVRRPARPWPSVTGAGVLAATVLLGFALAVLSAAGRRGAVLSDPTTAATSSLWMPEVIDVLVAVVVLGLGIAGSVAWLGMRRARSVGAVRILAAAFLVAGAATLANWHDRLYVQSQASIWLAAIPLPTSWAVPLTTVIQLLVTLVAIGLILFGLRRLVGDRDAQVRPLLLLLACGCLAYVVVYVLAPGYLFSGYVVRRASIGVFVTALVFGLAAYLMLVVPLRMLRSLRRSGAVRRQAAARSRPDDMRWPFALPARRAVAAVLLLLPVSLGLYWVNLQRQYITHLPPESFAILPRLREAPYHGATFIGNQAVASVAYFTQAWAYLDLKFEEGRVELTPDGYTVSRDLDSYIWFADRHTNPAYQYPEYYICLQHQYYEAIVERVSPNAVRQNVCGAKGIIAAASAPYWQDLRWQIVARDPSVDDRWAVVKLDWDFPPYLAATGPGTNPIGAQVESGADGAVIRVSYAYRQQHGVPEAGTVLRLYEARPGEATLRLLSEARGTDRLTVPSDAQGTIQVSVTPSTATKRGPEYFSEPLTCQPADGTTAARCVPGGTVPKLAALAFGDPRGLPADASGTLMRDAQHQPYVPVLGDLLFDTRSQSLSRLDVDGQLIRVILPDEQGILLTNAGGWDVAAKQYLGLPISSRNGQWTADTLVVPALNQNARLDAAPNPLADFTVAAPEGRTDVAPGTYSVTRIQGEEGPFTRITIHRDVPQFVLTASVPADPVSGLPLTMHTRVRVSGGTPVLAAYEIFDKGIAQPYVLARGVRSTQWQDLTLDQDEARFLTPAIRFALFALDPRAGDTIDVADLSASVSYLPRLEPKQPRPQP